MILCEFLGTSDHNFDKGQTYNLVKFEDNSKDVYLGYFKTWFLNNDGELKYIPYTNVNTFNDNWKMLTEDR